MPHGACHHIFYAHTHHTNTAFLGFLSNPCNSFQENSCCVKRKNADGFGFKSTAGDIAAGLRKRLDGKLAVVTGASAGLGKEMAKAFYETGATVVMACRNEAKTQAVMAWIRETAVAPEGQGKLVFVKCDLASLQSTGEAAEAIARMPEPLAVLMCNAGIMTPPFRLTGDGFESQFQVNYLSHYYLTMLLVDKLKAAPDGARVVNVSSISHAWVPFPGGCCGGCCAVLCCFGRANFSGGGKWPAKSGGCCAYDPMSSYAYTKAAQILFGAELDRRVFAGTKVMVLGAEPGLSAGTEMQAVNGSGSGCLACVLHRTPMACLLQCLGFLHDPTVLAGTGVYAALSDSAATISGTISKTSPSAPPPTSTSTARRSGSSPQSACSTKTAASRCPTRTAPRRCRTWAGGPNRWRPQRSDSVCAAYRLPQGAAQGGPPIAGPPPTPAATKHNKKTRFF